MIFPFLFAILFMLGFKLQACLWKLPKGLTSYSKKIEFWNKLLS